MARAGITKLDVHKAATRLLDNGQNPTVDSVRELMGTGSKSTIAPLLKQWKAEHDDWSEVKETGLPVSLIATVRALYDGMQKEAAEKIDDAQDIAMQALENSARLLHEKEQLLKSTDDELKKTEAYLKTANEDSALLRKQGVEKERQAQELTSQSHTLALQLKAAQKENEKLTSLNKQSQENLEHFRESTQQQRVQERDDMEQRLTETKTAMQMAQRETRSLNEKVTALLATVKKQEEESTRASNELSHITRENTLMVEKQKKAKEELLRTQETNQQLRNQLTVSDEQLNKYREDAEMFRTKAEDATTLLTEAIAKVDVYKESIQTLEQKNAAQIETVFKVKQENELLSAQIKTLNHQTK